MVDYSIYKLSSIKSNKPNTLWSISAGFLFLASAAKYLSEHHSNKTVPEKQRAEHQLMLPFNVWRGRRGLGNVEVLIVAWGRERWRSCRLLHIRGIIHAEGKKGRNNRLTSASGSDYCRHFHRCHFHWAERRLTQNTYQRQKSSSFPLVLTAKIASLNKNVVYWYSDSGLS